jgi:N-ethylmaleimide reductase
VTDLYDQRHFSTHLSFYLMSTSNLFEPKKVGSISLTNSIVMAPMTRCRAIGNVPNDLMATYYGQRAGA